MDARAAVTLEVVHRTRYDYAAPVTLAHHLAHLQPLWDAQQELLEHRLRIDPEPDHRRVSVDATGNAQCHFGLVQPHRWLDVVATSRLRVLARFAALAPASSPPWDALAASLRYCAGMPLAPEIEYAQPSPYVPRLAGLRRYAQPSFAPGRPVAEAAIELMQRLHADFRYEARSTAVDTPLAQVLAERRGVCQDFAHLMAGCLRMLGLPARYVSGYLLTTPLAGGAAPVGADASHAWVQVWSPQTPGVPDDGAGMAWLDLDPTNCVVPAGGHVRVAVGRDFGDVTPLRGVIRGGGRHRLSVAVATRVIEPVPPPAAADAAGPASCLCPDGQERETR